MRQNEILRINAVPISCRPSPSDVFNLDAVSSVRKDGFVMSDWLIFQVGKTMNVGQIKTKKRGNVTFEVFVLDGQWPGPYKDMKKVSSKWVRESNDGVWTVKYVKQNDILCGLKNIKYLFKISKNEVNENDVRVVKGINDLKGNDV